MLFPLAWAEVAASKTPNFIEQMVPFLFIFLIVYFLLIRPAQKRNKKHQFVLNQLKRGDNVLTSSGIMGTIYGLTDIFITLEIAENVRIRILRSQIASLTDSQKNQTKTDKAYNIE